MSDNKKLRGQRSRCGGCGEYFTTTSTFDRHRKGPYTDRTCLSVDALYALNWSRNKYGFWMRPGKPRVAGACDSVAGVQ